MVGCLLHQGVRYYRYQAENRTGRKSRPDYAPQKLTQQAKAFYEGIGVWLIS
ncbi:hypothetical protein D3C76_1774510 [compost metagenome]